MVLAWIKGLASYGLDLILCPQDIPFLLKRWAKGAERKRRSLCMYHGTLTTRFKRSDKFQLTSPSCCLFLGELIEPSLYLVWPSPCFPVSVASEYIPVSAGKAIRVLLVAVQLISLLLMQTASLGTEIT